MHLAAKCLFWDFRWSNKTHIGEFVNFVKKNKSFLTRKFNKQMTLQFIHDNRGNTTGVYIPIEEWQTLKIKYADLQEEEAKNFIEPNTWQKQILDDRLSDYYKNPNDVTDFNKTIDDIELSIG